MSDETVEQLRKRLSDEFSKAGDAYRRERTAATILAATLTPDDGYDERVTTNCLAKVAYAVAMADALRAELAKAKP